MYWQILVLLEKRKIYFEKGICSNVYMYYKFSKTWPWFLNNRFLFQAPGTEWNFSGFEFYWIRIEKVQQTKKITHLFTFYPFYFFHELNLESQKFELHKTFLNSDDPLRDSVVDSIWGVKKSWTSQNGIKMLYILKNPWLQLSLSQKTRSRFNPLHPSNASPALR